MTRVAMHDFDEGGLLKAVKALTHPQRVAFAAAAATRHLSSWERIADPQNSQRPREIVVQLWASLQTTVDRVAWTARRSEVEALLPEQDEDWTLGHALADDALCALAYAIYCWLSADPQEAVWAVRRAYEAADQAAIRILAVHQASAAAEALIRGHDVVQRELARQHVDLQDLRAGSMEALQRRAFADEAISAQEWALVAGELDG
jgi:uncharacterized protein YjaG (DUF416 family)